MMSLVGNRHPEPELEDRDADQRVVLQEPCPVSQSAIYDLLRRFYQERGPDAWQACEVPYYVTSNPFIARSYAEIVLGLARDLRDRGEADEPLVCLELGAGHGRFSHLFLRWFLRLSHEERGLPPLRLIASDHVAANLDFIGDHPANRGFLESGLLDLALFDPLVDSAPCCRGGFKLTLGGVAGPLVVFANYFLDGLPQDYFEVSRGRVHEVYLSLAGTEAQLQAPWRNMSQLDFRHSQVTVDENRYIETQHRASLNYYREHLEEGHISLPVAATRVLHKLEGFGRQGLLLLAADKGRADFREFEGCRPPFIDFHGSCSFEVNFEALLAPFEQQGAVVAKPTTGDRALTLVGMLDTMDPGRFPKTVHGLSRLNRDFCADAFYTLKRLQQEQVAGMGFHQIWSYLKFCDYDDYVFNQVYDRLSALIKDKDFADAEKASVLLGRIFRDRYSMPAGIDTAFRVGVLFYHLGLFDRAFEAFAASVEHQGIRLENTLNAALAATCFGFWKKAAHYLNLAEKCSPDHPRCSEMRDYINACAGKSDALEDLT